MTDHPPRQWLLLRGLAREASHWGAFLPQLQAAFPQDRIDTLDLPGAGRYASEPCPASIDAIVERCRQQALQQGLLQQPVILLGLSLGGMVSWQWLKQYPDDVSHAVLVNSSFASFSPFYQRLRWQAYAQFVGLLASRNLYDQELAIVRLVSNLHDDQRRFIAERWAEIRRRTPFSSRNLLNQLRAAARYQSGDSRPRQPVLVLNSAGDRLVSPACSQAIAAHFQLALQTHPSAGHDLPLDDGGWLIEQLRAWQPTSRG